MDIAQAIADTLKVGIEAALIWLAWHFLWRRSCQEVLRQRLFSLRDELFDFARTGVVDFEEPAYVLVRGTINSVIRFSHQISVTRLFIFIVLQPYIDNPDAGQGIRKITSAIAECPGKQAKEVLLDVHQLMHNEITKHILLASPQIVVLAPALITLNGLFSRRKPVSTDTARALRDKSAILIEAQAREAFKTERALRVTSAHPAIA